MGTGSGTKDQPLLEMVDNPNDLFVVNNATTSDEDIGGIVFQDMLIEYASGLTGGAAIRAINTQNIRVFRVAFYDCPQGVVFENVLQGLVRECTFIYETQNAGVAVTMDVDELSHGRACNQILVQKSDIRTLQDPNTCIGVAIYACKHATLQNLSISGLNTGILLSPSSEAQNDVFDTTILDCQVGAESAGLQLLPQSASGSNLQEVRVVSSSFTQGGDSAYTGAGIDIALPSGGTNSQLDTVKLIGVTSQGWQGPGLQVNAGQNIQVIGGTYAGNQAGETLFIPGVAITGTAENVSLVGVDLSATYLGSLAQSYALLVSGTPATILCKDCVMLGYSASPVNVTGSPTNLQIIASAGYNDQNTPLNGGHAPTGSGVSASSCSTPYFGPSVVTFSNTSAVTVHISGTGYSMSFSSIYLARPYDQIYFSSAPSPFTWIGK